MERDTQLDIYRGLLMMYIVCVIHVMYWLDMGREPYLSILLIEMPAIFFVSGASQSLVKKNRGLWESCRNRIRRVLLPYYIYAFVIILGISILSFVHYKPDYDILAYKNRDWMNVLIAQDIPQAHYIWHLWFIMPYLILSCTFGVQKKLIDKTSPLSYMLCCIIVHFVIQRITGNYMLRTVFCYNIFMVAGYLYYHKLSKNKTYALCAVLWIISAIYYSKWGGQFFPMQNHKFPPDTLFLLYGMAMVCSLSIIFGKIKLPYNNIIRIWNERGYTIYLYQSVVFFLVAHFIKYIDVIPSAFLQFLISALCVFTISTVLSYITYPIECYILNKLTYEKHRQNTRKE